MRLGLLLATLGLLLSGCAGKPASPDGVWINQAAIEAAESSGRLREALLAYGPNLEWQIDSQRGQARFSNGYEIGEGQLHPQGPQAWRVDFYSDYHEALQLQDDSLIQQAGQSWPQQAFVRPPQPAAAGAPTGSSFEQALYSRFLGGRWSILAGQGEGGLVLFQADGRLEGLPGADRYALCLAGDCAAMSGEHDSLWLQLGEQGSPWLFVRQGRQLEIFEALNRAQPDEMPDYYPGQRVWLLEQQ